MKNTPKNYTKLKKTNFSGRIIKGQNELKTAEEIIAQIDEAWNLETINSMRKAMEEHHNVKIAAKHILEIANKLKK